MKKKITILTICSIIISTLPFVSKDVYAEEYNKISMNDIVAYENINNQYFVNSEEIDEIMFYNYFYNDVNLNSNVALTEYEVTSRINSLLAGSSDKTTRVELNGGDYYPGTIIAGPYNKT